MHEEPASKEQMPFIDLPLFEEQGPEEQIQSAEQTFSEKVTPTPPLGRSRRPKRLFKDELHLRFLCQR